MSVRVRYAPSPTGHLHIGNARTALYNYLFAKSQGGKFLLRIEDTDTARNAPGGEESQKNFLRWLGLDWDEGVDVGGDFGPYRQLERLDIYKEYADELLDLGLAYKCYCTSEELEAERETQMAQSVDNIHYSRRCLDAENGELTARPEYVIRFKVPMRAEYVFNDKVRGEVTFKSEDVGDWVVMKSDGIPTYNFACAIDDHLMKISHVFRGEEHITNTPKQMMIFNAFGWEIPTFAHMTLIVNEHGKKLSKRDTDTIQFIEQFARQGYLPEALFNFIALLGWSPAGEQEILNHEELIQAFDASRLSKSPSTFDSAKLLYINEQYIKQLDADELLELCMPHLVEASILDEKPANFGLDLISLFQDRMQYADEIIDLYDEFFDDEMALADGAKAFISENLDGHTNTLNTFKSELASLSEFTAETVKAAIKETGKKAEVKGKNLFMPCRIGVSGVMHGPDLPKMVALLGQEVAQERLSAIIEEMRY